MCETGKDQYELPTELVAQPLSLIAFHGLSPSTSPLHQTVWETFNVRRRQERSPLLVRLQPPNHVYPRAKPRKTSYESYVARGILKRNWLKKHLTQIPAVAVFFAELDWNDPKLPPKQEEYAAQVRQLKASLEPWLTRVVVVLLQPNAPPPECTDAAATGKAAAFCTACNLPEKPLFLLPYGDHLPGYALRLENAFYDLAQAVYLQRIKRVRSHRDMLTKAHQPLLVRHLFKMAVFSELRQDVLQGQKHYAQAYSHLLEVRVADANLIEFRTIAGFVNYKLCKLAFQRNLPVDAISQFQRHMDVFRSRAGPPELLFEHHAWTAQQLNQFGNLFQEAVKAGLVAVQTQHPGFYYQLAAQYALQRKYACEKINVDPHTTPYPQPDPLSGEVDYYGQRPWRSGRMSLEFTDPALEKIGVLALQLKEKTTVMHSEHVISLLGNAMAQFKRFHCFRTHRKLVVQMAEEYCANCQWESALNLILPVVWEYREERWGHLLSVSLRLAMKCAYITGKVSDFVTLLVEAIGPLVPTPKEGKQLWYSCLIGFLKGEVPPFEELSTDLDAWTEVQCVDVELLSRGLIQATAKFKNMNPPADEKTVIDITLTSNCGFPLSLEYISVSFSNTVYNVECAEKFTIRPGANRVFSFDFVACVEDEGRDIAVTKVFVKLGVPEAKKFVMLKIPFSDPRPAAVRIAPRASRLEVELSHKAPALIGEFYPITAKIKNAETGSVQNLKMDVSLMNADDTNLAQSTQLFCEKIDPDSSGATSFLPMVQADELAVGASAQQLFYIKGSREGERHLLIKMEYMLKIGHDTRNYSKELSITVPMINPFQISVQLLSTKFGSIINAYAGEVFVVSPEVTSQCPWPIRFRTTRVDLEKPFSLEDSHDVSHLCDIECSKGDTVSESFCVKTNLTQPRGDANIGSYVLTWTRVGFENAPSASTCVTLPVVSILPCLLSIAADLPAFGWVRTPMSISFKVCNCSEQLLFVTLCMETSDAFMFAGNKKVNIQLPPDAEEELKYNLYPLFSGFVALPQLRLLLGGKEEAEQAQVDSFVERTLPSHVYIMPQGKKRAKECDTVVVGSDSTTDDSVANDVSLKANVSVAQNPSAVAVT